MDRLTNLIKPNKIFMGEKDYQQLYLVKKFIEKKYKSKIIGCNTIRAKNKYALSSRNFLLKNIELDKAGKIAKLLINFKRKLIKKENIQKILSSKKLEIEKNYDVKIEYLEARKEKDLLITNNIKKSRIFIAYYLDKVRLIDNF
jgi:pantoate--beta-alanine ligase